MVWGVPHGVGQSLPLVYGLCLFHTAQEATGCLCRQGTPWPHVQITARYHPEAFPTQLLPSPLSSACPIAGTLPSPGQHLTFAVADFHEVPVSPLLQDPLVLPQDMLCWMVADYYCEEAYRNVIIHIRVPRPTWPINSKSKCLWINIRSSHNVVKLFATIVLL